MTQEEKQLLLTDLSARLRYGVIVNYKEGEYDFHKWKIETLDAPAYSEGGLLIETNGDGWIGYTEYIGCGMSSASRALHLDKNLPYLRPMSSMTDEEKEELKEISAEYLDKWMSVKDQSAKWELDAKNSSKRAEFYNSHYLDWNGLIEKGLALEAPEGMYKTE